MRYAYRFDQVLNLREQEKTEVELAYQAAVDQFEKTATELYELLKRKEDTIRTQQEEMKKGFSVTAVRHYAFFIEGLESSIEFMQRRVQKARTNMAWHEDKLLEKTQEIRKYEKMKEKDYERFQQESDRLEMIRTDELASAQFFNRENW
ncbi:flagellar export protein FliJ [Indiicoccus explosivorum]|uniref:flagellar export protein FliJ n=1 Tax=Indiicoccus explosivorum TaxID=1917864 RepID=UPI000B42FCF5|nr:flagellar export protein FliJ [Indiicoccus explosivorum]